MIFEYNNEHLGIYFKNNAFIGINMSYEGIKFFWIAYFLSKYVWPFKMSQFWFVDVLQTFLCLGLCSQERAWTSAMCVAAVKNETLGQTVNIIQAGTMIENSLLLSLSVMTSPSDCSHLLFLLISSSWVVSRKSDSSLAWKYHKGFSGWFDVGILLTYRLISYNSKLYGTKIQQAKSMKWADTSDWLIPIRCQLANSNLRLD